MKKQLRLSGAIALCVGLSVSFSSTAQTNNNSNRLDPNSIKAKEQSAYENTNSRISNLPVVVNPKTAPEAVLWSEDFASGFTGGVNGNWTVGGANSNWVQYDTDGPDNLLQFGWGPLPSPTTGNGFAIFDFYDRFPDPNGFATSPAEGTLTSPVINLGTNADVELVFYQQFYHCCNFEWNGSIDISTDGGTSFPNSINVTEDFDRNERHWNLGLGYEFRYKLKNYIQADPSNVVLRFNWTSLTADANGQFTNTYFWMIDDIELRDVPAHSLQFTVASDGAPAHDAIIDGDGANTRMGIMPLFQKGTVTFDSNILNYGTETQDNLKLIVKIVDDQGTVVDSLFSAANGVSAAEDDTITYTQMVTSASWDPQATGTYSAVFTVHSDSINVAGFEIPSDTINFFITDSLMSEDHNIFSNNHGTNDLGDDGSAVAARYLVKNANSDTTGYTFIESIDLRFSTQSTAGGEVLIEVYDTNGFDFTGGFGGSALYSKSFDVTTAMVGGTGTFPIQDSVWNTWTQSYDVYNFPLQSGKPYFFVVYMFSNSGASPVQLANDQTFPQQGNSSVMYNVGQARWFTGYQNSLTFNSPWIRVRYGATPASNIGLDEEVKAFDFDVYPNPVSTGSVNIELSKGGTYDIELVNTTGQIVKTETLSVNGVESNSINVSDLAKGVYIMNVTGDNTTESVKVTIQ